MTYNISQSASQDALAVLFVSKARVAVLRLFLIDPSRSYYQRQVEAATGLAIRAVQRELERLTSVGLFYRRQDGNRIYYHTDRASPLFPELRAMVLKTCDPEERLRAALAVDDSVRLAFLLRDAGRVLVVKKAGRGAEGLSHPPYTVKVVSSEDFSRALREAPQTLAPFLREGVDILGRRDDALWHQIEKAGFGVEKGKGVA